MSSRWGWILLQFSRKLWVRVSLFCIGAIVTAMAGILLQPYISAGQSIELGAKSIDSILSILASSMLAVTTFSLTTMVSAYAAATNNATPRATKLLIDDPTTQNALSTFIGSFLYSLVGIIALSAGAYGDSGRLVLFVVTIGVIALIVVTLLRWIDYLSGLGRVGETTDKVENATSAAIKARLRHPFLGGRPLRHPDSEIPPAAKPLFSEKIGYVQHIDTNAISACAEEHGGQVFVTALSGTFVHSDRPIARVQGIEDEAALNSIRTAFFVGVERSFEQDPRFGLCVLSEIASRALSPAMNDPGTAIDVIGRAVRVLLQWAPGETIDPVEGAAYDRVWVPPVRAHDMFDDLFAPISRDGASVLEVQMRLQKAFAALWPAEGGIFKSESLRHSQIALERAEAALQMDHERDRIRELAKSVGT